MIKSLELKNFQSHKDTKLDFHPGVNVIIGSSRSGKTAVLRALNWNRYNKPAGLALNSYWNRDKKKQPIEPHSSMVLFDDVSVSRNRSAEYNGYLCGDKKYEAMGQGVPDDVESLWNMSEVNIQKQFDSPFLLSESAAEVARFFNKTIHLDKIDVVLSNAESKRRKLNSSILENTKMKESLETEIAEMDWIDDVELMIAVAEAKQECILSKNDTIQKLTDALEVIDAEYKKLRSIPRNLDKVLKDMASAKSLDSFIEAEISEEQQLRELLVTIESQKVVIKKGLNPTHAQIVLSMMEGAKKISDGKSKKFEEEVSLRELLQAIQKNRMNVALYRTEVETLMAQMPKTCPTCGQTLGEKRMTND